MKRIRGMMATTAPIALLLALPAQAQDVVSTVPEVEAAEEIVVTGSRIRRAADDTPFPMGVIGNEVFAERGFVSAAQALNNQPSLNAQLVQSDGSGNGSGSGIQSPSLFGLGTGRTLTLINGRRMVTTSSGLGDSQVDSNLIPVGLLERVEIVEGSGAAVYGSDAIAGVVNYVLKKDFQGVELDAQGGITDRGDYGNYSARLTAGQNFGGGRGNVAVNVEWSKTDALPYASRPRTQLSRITVPNPANDPTRDDGIPATQEIFDARFWPFNRNGVIFQVPGPVPNLVLGQFSNDGSGILPFDSGTRYGIPFASGGDGFRYSDLVGTLRTGVERVTANVISQYELSDSVRLSTELLYGRTIGREVGQLHSNTVIGATDNGTGAIPFTINNPFLTDAARASLSALNPGFSAGAPLFLSRAFEDINPSREVRYTTESYRALLGLDGKFSIGSRNFDWSISGSYARVDGKDSAWDVILARYNNAINAVAGPDGPICAINADPSSPNADPACAPINPFGNGNVSDAARQYVSGRSGNRYRNEQYDFLATLGGELFDLPAGTVRFAATYEHRDESVKFTPFEGDQQGIFGVMPVLPQSGSYNTDEFAGELLVPLVGRDFTLPLVNALELSAAFRHVDNSIAGKENVWNLGLRWEPVQGVTLRASRSRNFRAPTLTQLVAPSAQNLENGNWDPCDADRINGGPNPAQRRAACLALFEANPTFGTDADGTGAGQSAADRLARFQNSGENFTTTLVTSGGNPNLRNETSKTWTYGAVIQPSFIPGLTLSVDRIEIDLKDGLSPFTTQEFAEACFDDPNPSDEVCNAFTRMMTPTANSQAGSFATGTTTTYNAGIIRFRGETYKLNYMLPLDRIVSGDWGTLDFSVSATHTALLESSVTGAVFTRGDNTAINPITSTPQPDWAGRFDLRYANGPFRMAYQAFYMSPVIARPNDTVETNPNWKIAGNTTHSLSFQYELERFTLRAGVDNLTDKQPSYPTLNYGDILGRRFFVGAKVRM